MSKGGGSSGNTSTTTTTQSPPAQYLQAYQNLTDRAFQQANAPLQQYDQPLVAGFTPQQAQGFQTIQNLQGSYVPWLNAAGQEFSQATQPIWSTLPSFDTSSLPQGALDRIGQSSDFATAAGNLPIAQQVGQFTDQATTAAASTPSNISTFESPYTKAVTDATRALFNQQNAEQLAQQRGSTIGAGAFGGDRQAVSEALLGKQQQLAQAPVLANIQQQGYQAAVDAAQKQAALEAQTGIQGGQLTSGALTQQGQLGLGAGQLGLAGGQQLFNEFNAQQQAQQAAETANRWLAAQSGQGLASIGSLAQSLGLAGAAANIGAGKQQQDLAQQQLNIPYEQFVQRQAYPYQQLNFLAPIVQGTGGLTGGTSSTSVPGPSTLSQVAGLGTAGLGLFGQTGAFGDSGYLTGLGGLFNPAPDFSTMAGATPGNFVFPGEKHGGRIGLAGGGIPGGALEIDSGVPDVSVDMIPALTNTGVRSPVIDSFMKQGQTTTTSGGGGGSAASTAGGIIGTGLGLAKLASFFLKDGGLAGGGDADEVTPLETQKPVSPGLEGSQQRYEGMDEEKLQEMAVRTPAGSTQGEMIRRALAKKRMGASLNTPAPANLPTNYLPLQSKGLAGGGDTDEVSEDDMDDQPIVDHSGKTVVIHYPSEGRSLDLGIPSFPEDGLAEGGKADDEPDPKPVGSFNIPKLSPLSTTFKAGTPNEVVNQTRYEQPGFSYLPAPGGVALPAMWQPHLFGAPGTGSNPAAEPGGGLGNWFNPLPQLSPPENLGIATVPGLGIATGGGGSGASTSAGSLSTLGGQSVALPGGFIGSYTGSLADLPLEVKQTLGLAAEGGRVERAEGGGLGSTQGVPHISLDFIHPPGPVVKGSGPPKPPAPAKEPEGLDPSAMLKAVGDVLPKKEEGLAAGGEADDNDLVAKADLPPVATTRAAPGRGRLPGPPVPSAAMAGLEDKEGKVGPGMPPGPPPTRIPGDEFDPGKLPPIPETGTSRGQVSAALLKAEPSAKASSSSRRTDDAAAPSRDEELPAREPYKPGLAANPWMALTAAGLGMMGGTSPFAAVNIGRGGLEGIKVLQQQEKENVEAERLNNQADLIQVRAQAASDRADAILRMVDYRNQSLAQHAHDAETTNAIKQQNANSLEEARRANAESKRLGAEAQTMRAQSDRMRTILQQQKPQPIYKPDTGEVGYVTFNPEKASYDIPEGWAPGKPHALSVFEQTRNAYRTIHKDDPDVEQKAFEAATHNSGIKDAIAFGNLVARRAGQLQTDPNYMTKPEAERNELALSRALADFGRGKQEVGAPGAAPPASPAAPTQQWTQEHPLVPKSQKDIDDAPSGSVIQTPKGMMVKP